MKKIILMFACVMGACGAEDTATDEGAVIDCNENNTCEGGGGQGTPEQMCHAAAVGMCASLGYAGNTYCLLVFNQGCSPVDDAAAQVYCLLHPEIQHGPGCALIWR